MIESSGTHPTNTFLDNEYIYWEHELSCSITSGVEWSILFHNQLYIDMIESSGTHTTSTSLYNEYIYWEHEVSCSVTLGVEWSILCRYDMSLTKWLPNFRMILSYYFSLRMMFHAQQLYLNSLYTLPLCISDFEYRYGLRLQ